MLYEEDIVYRPPLEAQSALLEITCGCTYGKCSFCRCSDGTNKFHCIALPTIAVNAQLLGVVE